MPQKPITAARIHRRQVLDKVLNAIVADEAKHQKSSKDTWSEINLIERQTDLLLRLLNIM